MTQQKVNVDLTKIANLQCECGNKFFIATTVIKKIPKFLIAAPQDVLYAINVYKCDNCMKLLPESENLILEPEQKPVIKLT